MAMAHVEMHSEHRQWLSDNAMWRDDLALWQNEIDQAHGGPGRGSEFVIRLPVLSVTYAGRGCGGNGPSPGGVTAPPARR